MKQRRSHRQKHASKKPREDTSLRAMSPEVEELGMATQESFAPSEGPWSAWTADPEGRAFYYRNRLGINGQMEWQFSPISPSQVYNSLRTTRHATRGCNDPFSPSPAAAPFLTSAPSYATQYPTNAFSGENNPSRASDFTHDSDDQESVNELLSGFTIPAIIDVDMENNIKVMVPNIHKGETTLMLDHKRRHSQKSRMNPGARVREWLQSEFGA